MKRASLVICAITTALCGQEAESGFELRTTLSGAASYSHKFSMMPRAGGPLNGGFRSMFYPAWKLSRNWTVSGAFQVHSRPYFYEQFTTQGRGVKGDLLQAHLSYARFWNDKSVVVRVGQLSSAFGAFLLRYDDADNPLIDIPLAYGYYYKSVSVFGLAGAQVDATAGKLDARAQFVNSSPGNRRSIFDSDQYGNWAGGIGYTILQGFRVGVSAYRGPYAHRGYAFYRPGEVNPRDLPGSGYGLDVQWGRGAWNISGEWQRFQRIYRVTRTVNQHTGYAEARYVLHPRWYLAARTGYLWANTFPGREAYDTVVGFRPNRHQLLKIGYQVQRGRTVRGTLDNTFSIQLVTRLGLISVSRD